MQVRFGLAVVLIATICIATSAFVFVSRIEQRKATTAGLQQVTQIGCDRDRHLISQLRALIQRSRDNARQYHKDGLLNDDQYERAISENEHALRVLALPDCTAVVLLVR